MHCVVWERGRAALDEWRTARFSVSTPLVQTVEGWKLGVLGDVLEWGVVSSTFLFFSFYLVVEDGGFGDAEGK
jgi:hypothetical protein